MALFCSSASKHFPCLKNSPSLSFYHRKRAPPTIQAEIARYTLTGFAVNTLALLVPYTSQDLETGCRGAGTARGFLQQQHQEHLVLRGCPSPVPGMEHSVQGTPVQVNVPCACGSVLTGPASWYNFGWPGSRRIGLPDFSEDTRIHSSWYFCELPHILLINFFSKSN